MDSYNLPAEALFDHLLNRPEAENIGAKVNAAMRDVEKHNPQLAGVLPKTYNLFTSTLLKEQLKKVSEIPASLDYDTFGRILDPACGSGGMFVSSARFVSEHKKNPAAKLCIHGVEKTDGTGRLCRLNLAVHGLEGEIKHGGNIDSYYDDPHDATGRFNFVLANPPFNVNAVDKELLRDMVGPGRRFPFGLPRTDNATATRGSAKTKPAKPDRRSGGETELHYLWIQLLYSALNGKDRAGFVMANSASGARSSKQDIRQNLIELERLVVRQIRAGVLSKVRLRRLSSHAPNKPPTQLTTKWHVRLTLDCP